MTVSYLSHNTATKEISTSGTKTETHHAEKRNLFTYSAQCERTSVELCGYYLRQQLITQNVNEV